MVQDCKAWAAWCRRGCAYGSSQGPVCRAFQQAKGAGEGGARGGERTGRLCPETCAHATCAEDGQQAAEHGPPHNPAAGNSSACASYTSCIPSSPGAARMGSHVRCALLWRWGFALHHKSAGMHPGLTHELPSQHRASGCTAEPHSQVHCGAACTWEAATPGCCKGHRQPQAQQQPPGGWGPSESVAVRASRGLGSTLCGYAPVWLGPGCCCADPACARPCTAPATIMDV